MEPYAGIDLHSSDKYLGIIDEKDRKRGHPITLLPRKLKFSGMHRNDSSFFSEYTKRGRLFPDDH